MKKAFVILVSALLLLTACSNGESGDTVESTAISDGDYSVLRVSDLPEYVLVRPDAASAELTKSFHKLRDAINEKTSVNLPTKTDFFREDKEMFKRGEYEILVGATEREESVNFIKDLRSRDYGYALVNKKLVIAGKTEDATILAVDAFIKDVLKSAGPGIFYSSRYDRTVYGEYDVKELFIGDIPIEDFRIVYPRQCITEVKECVRKITDAVGKTCGFLPEAVNDRTPREEFAHEILIGNTNRDGTSADQDGAPVISFDGTDVRINGPDAGSVCLGIGEFISKVSSLKGDTVKMKLENKEEINVTAMTAMSFNVLVSKMTEERSGRVVEMVKKYMPDTVGFQEASPSWMEVLKNGLSDVYAFTGEGRNGGDSGEYNPIFYNKNKFTLISSKTQWLSDTPGFPSKYSESSLNRIFTYALLERKEDGKRLMVINTHFDHTNDTARERQAKVLARFISENLEYPIILTGDFNTSASSAAFNTVVSSGVVNSYAVAAKSETAPTFTDFGSRSAVIDFIFIDPLRIAVRSYKVCNEKINGEWPSDHHPVLIEYMA